MLHQYSEADTERARQAERDAAMAQPAGTYSAGRTRHNSVALLLIALGAVLMLGRFLPGRGAFTGGMVLLTIASAFLFFAFWKRTYGLLIPGSILAGLGVGVPFAGLTNGVSVLWGLALGFLAIFFIGRQLYGVRSSWPVYPATILGGVGVIVAVSSLPWFMAGSVLWLPLLLVGLGLYLGWGPRPGARS
jgi:hypothetical protein